MMKASAAEVGPSWFRVHNCLSQASYMQQNPSGEAKRFSAMGPEGSLPNSQVPATCPYPEPGRPTPCPSSYFVKIHLNIILPSTPESPGRLFPSVFPTKTLYTPLLSPHTRYMTRPSHILDFITRKILGDEYRTFSSSLCNFLHCPLTPSLLGPNILLNTLFSNTLSLCTSRNVKRSGWSTPRPVRFTSGRKTQYTFYRWQGRPQGRSGRAPYVNILPQILNL